MRCSGMILAGGRNARMGGRPKALLRLGGWSYIERIAAAMRGWVENILVVSRTPNLYSGSAWITIKDILPARSPLAGIHAGLVHSQNDFVLCSSCDIPLLYGDLVGMVVESIENGYDIVVPASGTYYQPLCAVYSRRCLGPIEDQLAKNDFKVDHLFERMKVKQIPYEKLQTVDPQLESFFNVNSHADIAAANRLLRGDRERRSPIGIPDRSTGYLSS